MSVRQAISQLQENMKKEIVGQEEIIESLVIGLLADGNLLVEGLPGLAKTRAIKALSNNIEGEFARIQFTPDLVSEDITGREVYYSDGKGQEAAKFIKGPVFANIVLADEINRAPSKTQNALLEAMEERQVTIGAVAHRVPDLFMVMATQNPAGQHGTYPLPEAQMDRFLMHINVEYPDEEAEQQIIRLVRGEASQETRKSDKKAPVERQRTTQKTIFEARGEIDKVKVPSEVEKYLVDLVFATRYPQRYTYELKSYIACGVSPRGSLALDRCCRVRAWLDGRDTVDLETVQKMAGPVFRHRINRGDRAIEHRISADDIVKEIIDLVPLPGREETRRQAAN